MLLGLVLPGCTRGRWGRRRARGESGDVLFSEEFDGNVVSVVVQESPRICSSKLFVSGFSGTIVCVFEVCTDENRRG